VALGLKCGTKKLGKGNKAMYVEIKTDDPAELRRAFDEVINKGQQAMLTLGKDGDFYSLSVNEASDEPPVAST
jgi:hypothetical protein